MAERKGEGRVRVSQVAVHARQNCCSLPLALAADLALEAGAVPDNAIGPRNRGGGGARCEEGTTPRTQAALPQTHFLNDTYAMVDRWHAYSLLLRQLSRW